MTTNTTQEDEISTTDHDGSETGSIQTFDSQSPEQPGNVRFDQAVWAVWWIGTILIVLSWIGTVSSTVGWIGFAAALASTFASVVARKYWRIPR